MGTTRTTGTAQLRRTAERQRGLFTIADARRRGVSPDAIRHLAARGLIRPVFRGVFAFAGPPSFEQTVLAACLVTGGVACSWTAAQVYGLKAGPATPVHVVVSPHEKRRPRAGIVVHHSTVGFRRVLTDRLPVTSPARTLTDLAAAGASQTLLAEFAGLIVIDGFAHHSSRDAFERDRIRGNDLASAGLTVVHVTAAQVNDRPAALRRQLEAALACKRPRADADRAREERSTAPRFGRSAAAQPPRRARPRPA